MKKVIAILFVICMLFTAACGSATAAGKSESAPAETPNVTVAEPEPSSAPAPAPAETPAASNEVEEDGQNPVMNFVGPYVCDRANVLIEADGAHGAKASVTWSSSATELSEWSMSGIFDEETLSFKYSNGIKTNYVYGEDGFVTSTETVYKDGSGTFAFTVDGILSWVDDTEHAADGMLFTFNAEALSQWDLS
ncbi:MAG: hypothetical protein K5771_05390 [Oscillospiraceae bacterium]|nr:hypothetical protein [Oscillospiraceae bacterium]